MSRMSHFFIFLMAAGLAFMAGLRIYQAYERYAEKQADEYPASMTFQSVPLQQGPAPIAPSIANFHQPMPPAREIYLQDEPLSPQLEKEQARQTVAAILDDYRNDAVMQAFYADLRAATGRQDITLETLSGEGLGALIRQYPQVQGVIAKHSQNPEFVRTMQEIFNNPQFIYSVAVLQGRADKR